MCVNMYAYAWRLLLGISLSALYFLKSSLHAEEVNNRWKGLNSKPRGSISCLKLGAMSSLEQIIAQLCQIKKMGKKDTRESTLL